MYQHILLAVAPAAMGRVQPACCAAREAAVALAHGSGAQLSVLSVYDYDYETPEAMSPSRGGGPLSGHPDGPHGRADGDEDASLPGERADTRDPDHAAVEGG